MKKAKAFLIVFFVSIALLGSFPILVHGQQFCELWIVAHEGGTTDPIGSILFVPTVPPERIIVKAIPNQGWDFDHWELDGRIVGTDPSYNVTMDNSHLLEAFFKPHPVGGYSVSIGKPALLAPYIALASTIVGATVATAIYLKRVKRRKEKQ
jgi:hypothetical protein